MEEERRNQVRWCFFGETVRCRSPGKNQTRQAWPCFDIFKNRVELSTLDKPEMKSLGMPCRHHPALWRVTQAQALDWAVVYQWHGEGGNAPGFGSRLKAASKL
jgi:hypothetical protein